MVDRTVTAKFQADVAGAIANIARLTKSIVDSARAGTDFAAKNKASFDSVAHAAAGIGITSAVALGAAVKAFADFDKEMSNVRAATGETAGNMELLRAAALKAGKDTAFSATEAAQGIENLAKAGVSTKDILGGGLTGALNLAAAGQIGVADAAEVAATAMTQFKLSGKDVPHIADLLAAGAGKAQGEVGDMAAALKQGGLVASQFGLSVEETTGTLAAFASAGLIGSDAGTSLKTMLLSLASPSKQAADTMKQLGLNAYDAKGAFIGIAPLAEQLKTKLGGLSQEQRNAALSTIFGTDAIRAASVLYDQGAKGVVDWTTKVNDTGFAAQQAATKMDNLSGDVEKLKGSLDTALIQGGSGANSVLRGLVESADGLVTAFANLPPAVSGVATALAAVGTFGGLGAAGALKAASAAGQLREAWQGLGRVGKTLTLSMGAVGVALAAAGFVYSAFVKRNEEAKAKVSNLKDTLDQATGAITGNTRAYVANQLASSGLAEKAKSFGLSLSSVTDAALGNKTAMDSVVASLDKIITTNESLASGLPQGSGKALLDSAQAARDLKNELTGTNAGLTEAQKQQKLAAEGAKTDATAQETAAAAHKAAAAAAQVQAASLDDLIAAMLRMPGQVLSLRDAQRGYQQSLDDATAALKENGKTAINHGAALQISTQKGRDNQAALDAIAKSANDVTKTLRENGASQKTLSSNTVQTSKDLYAAARQFGLNDKAARAYVKSVQAVPQKATTTISNNAPAAKAKVDPYTKALNLLPKTKTTGVVLTGASSARSQVLNLSGAINNLPSQKNVYVKLIQSGSVGGIPASVKAPGKATGGPIQGYSPSATADNIPVMATAGEYMHNVAAVQYYGPGFMDAVNTRSFPKPAGYKDGGLIRGYATGGAIGGLDIGTLISLLFAAPGNPLAGSNPATELTAARRAAAAQVSAMKALTQQQVERNRATAEQARIQAQLDAQRSKTATDRTNGASDATIKTDQLRQIALTKQLNAAKANTKKQTADVTAAEKAYAKAADASKATSDKYKDSIEKLNQVREQATALARQVADTQLQGTDVSSLAQFGAQGLLAGKQAKAKDLASFASTLEKLQSAGLSKELLDQIRSGGLANSNIATDILSSGQGYIKSLNASEGQIQAQAARIGAGAAAQFYNTTYLTNRIEIGGEVVKVVQQVIRSSNAATKQAATRR